jgi:hypothetical protein
MRSATFEGALGVARAQGVQRHSLQFPRAARAAGRILRHHRLASSASMAALQRKGSGSAWQVGVVRYHTNSAAANASFIARPARQRLPYPIPTPLNAPSHHATQLNAPSTAASFASSDPYTTRLYTTTHLTKAQRSTGFNSGAIRQRKIHQLQPQPLAPHAPDANPRYPTPRPLPPTHAIPTTPPLPPAFPRRADANATTPHPTTGQRLPASTATRTNAPPADTT